MELVVATFAGSKLRAIQETRSDPSAGSSRVEHMFVSPFIR